jgi:hypothetical protein
MERELRVLLESFRCARDTGNSEDWDNQVRKLQSSIYDGVFSGVALDNMLTVYQSSRCASKDLVILTLDLLLQSIQ